MKLNRRELVACALAGGLGPAAEAAKGSYPAKPKTGPPDSELARAAALPVLKREGLDAPALIQSLDLLKAGSDYLVRVRSRNGAEGISVCNPPRADYLDRIFKNLVAPPFLGKDARDLDKSALGGIPLRQQLQAVRDRAVESAGVGGDGHSGHAGPDERPLHRAVAGRCAAQGDCRLRGQRPARYHAAAGDRVSADRWWRSPAPRP